MIKIKFWTLLLIIIVFIWTILIDYGQCADSHSSSDSNFLKSQTKKNKYLKYIFSKYGSNGIITFEGLEHLLYNLGLGNLEFNQTHTIEEHYINGVNLTAIIQNDDEPNGKNSNNLLLTVDHVDVGQNDRIIDNLNDQLESNFKNMHDVTHQHPRLTDDNELRSCLSPASMLRMINISARPTIKYEDLHKQQRRSIREKDIIEHYEQMASSDVQITAEDFVKICPAIIAQIDQGACIQRRKLFNNHENQHFEYAWLYATVSIIVISLFGLIGVVIIPLTKTKAYEEILRFLVALAIGTLCGDALMHLLPHALISHTTDDRSNTEQKLITDDVHANQEPIWLCACTFFTILFMYTIEHILKSIRSNGHAHHHHHGHSHGGNNKPITNSNEPKLFDSKSKSMDLFVEESNVELNIMLDRNEMDVNRSEDTDPNRSSKKSMLSPIAFMVILGDGLHNLTDGMAIGAAFAIDPVTGMATALAVLFHELPHELGDFGLLLKNGVKIKRVIFFNIMSSFLSLIGMLFGLFITQTHINFARWIYAATSGSFLYIALADLVPELSRDCHTIKHLFIQVFGIACGGFLMISIALYEDKLKILFE